VRDRTLQVTLWLALWILFTMATRVFHPTLLIALTATGCLELASASAVYLNELLLVPKFLLKRRFFLYSSALILSVSVITVGVVFLIQAVYNILWRPDPRRLGLWTNIESDFAWIAIHLLFGACAFRIWRH
jgi:hypothetical protein